MPWPNQLAVLVNCRAGLVGTVGRNESAFTEMGSNIEARDTMLSGKGLRTMAPAALVMRGKGIVDHHQLAGGVEGLREIALALQAVGNVMVALVGLSCLVYS